MSNNVIRCALITCGVKQYQLADKLGVAEATLSRKLRKELPPEDRQKILAAIEELAKGDC